MVKKSWQQKLQDSKDLPKVVQLDQKAQSRWKGETLAIPSPLEVNEIMASVPKGKLITTDLIRKIIARKHGAHIGCPLTTGIFSSIAAHAAEEERAENKQEITPWWRTLKSSGELNEKYPGGIENQSRLLKAEGHSIIQKGKKFRVADYEKALIEV